MASFTDRVRSSELASAATAEANEGRSLNKPGIAASHPRKSRLLIMEKMERTTDDVFSSRLRRPPPSPSRPHRSRQFSQEHQRLIPPNTSVGNAPAVDQGLRV